MVATVALDVDTEVVSDLETLKYATKVGVSPLW